MTVEQVREDFTLEGVKTLDFTTENSFDEIISDPVHWTMMSKA